MTEYEYGCERCWAYHCERDGPVYTEHLTWQSKRPGPRLKVYGTPRGVFTRYDCCGHCRHDINDPPHDRPCPDGCTEERDPINGEQARQQVTDDYRPYHIPGCPARDASVLLDRCDCPESYRHDPYQHPAWPPARTHETAPEAGYC